MKKRYKPEELVEIQDEFQALYEDEKREYSQEHFELLYSLAESQTAYAREVAAKWLAIDESKKSEQILYQLLSDKDPLVRLEATDSIYDLGRTLETCDKLVEILLKSRDSTIRFLAADAIGYNIKHYHIDQKNRYINALLKKKATEPYVNTYTHIVSALYRLDAPNIEKDIDDLMISMLSHNEEELYSVGFAFIDILEQDLEVNKYDRYNKIKEHIQNFGSPKMRSLEDLFERVLGLEKKTDQLI